MVFSSPTPPRSKGSDCGEKLSDYLEMSLRGLMILFVLHKLSINWLKDRTKSLKKDTAMSVEGYKFSPSARTKVVCDNHRSGAFCLT